MEWQQSCSQWNAVVRRWNALAAACLLWAVEQRNACTLRLKPSSALASTNILMRARYNLFSAEISRQDEHLFYLRLIYAWSLLSRVCGYRDLCAWSWSGHCKHWLSGHFIISYQAAAEALLHMREVLCYTTIWRTICYIWLLGAVTISIRFSYRVIVPSSTTQFNTMHAVQNRPRRILYLIAWQLRFCLIEWHLMYDLRWVPLILTLIWWEHWMPILHKNLIFIWPANYLARWQKKHLFKATEWLWHLACEHICPWAIPTPLECAAWVIFST